MQSKRKVNKRKCLAYEIYCVRCRLPQLPDGNMADFEPINCTMGRLIGLCPSCNGIINKYFNIAQLENINGQLDISLPKALEHISESVKPLLNSDFKK